MHCARCAHRLYSRELFGPLKNFIYLMCTAKKKEREREREREGEGEREKGCYTLAPTVRRVFAIYHPENRVNY